jgi:hypothetical protein
VSAVEKQADFEMSPPSSTPQRKEKPAFGNYKLQQPAANFNAEQQFKTSLLEVIGVPEQNQNNNRLYTMQRQALAPPPEYLARKRGSVF